MSRRFCWAVSLIGLVGVAGALRAQAPAGLISTYAGGGKSKNDGVPATDYKLSSPSDVAVDALGNIYIADSGNNQIVKVDRATQILTVVAGTGKRGYNGDNIPAISATLDNPVGIAFDTAGNLYISDNNNARIRRVDSFTGIITTYAGTGVSGYNADNIQARLAELNDPYHISFDPNGNLYIADASNNRVRRVAPTGVISTVAGTGHAGYNGDHQPAAAAELNKPLAAVADNSGNLYIADNKNTLVRLVSGGTITTYAGTRFPIGLPGNGVPATLAKLQGPNNLGLDAAGHLYIADEDDNKVRRVDRNTLLIDTVAGDGRSGYSGDGGPAVDASIAKPFTAKFDLQGRMYIAEFGSDVVRLVTFAGSPAAITVVSGSPQTTRVNTNFAERLTAAVRDSNGNGVSGVTVTFAVPAGGASATLSSPTAMTDTAGEAFVFATANSTAGSYSVTATTTGVATPATFSLTNTVSAFVSVVFVQQPSNTTAGVAISPPVTVRVTDLNGNPVSGAAVTVGIFASSRSIQGTITQTTDASGIATFADLKVQTAGTYSLEASTGAEPPVGSTSFTVAAAAPRFVAVVAGSGQSTPALTPFAEPLTARVTDEFGNVVPAVAVTFVAPASGPSATFGGPAAVNTGSDGVATSPILTANATAGAFNVAATAAGASSAAFSLTNLSAVPKFVTFLQQPAPSTAAGSAMAPPIIVQVKDEFQTSLPGVQVAMLVQGPSEDLTGTTTRITDTNGLATFNDLSITQAGANYRLDAVAIGSSAEALSNSFTITGGAPAAISVLSGGTQSATILTPYAIPLTVIVEDQFLNPVSGATVVFTAPTSGASGLFSGSATANVVTDAEGQAAAPITANGTAGAFTVNAGVGAFSAAFQLTNTPGAPGRIVFSQQPPATVTAGATITPPVQVKLDDASGNGVPGVAVTLTPGSTKRSAPVSATTDAGGFATFATLTINTAGTYVLEAVAEGVSAQSNTVTVTAGSAALITAHGGSGQTSTVATLFHPLEARVTDNFGNPVSGVSVTFTPPSSGPSVTGIPATIPTGSDGIATSPAITANTVAGTFQVTATGAGSAAFTLTNAPGAGILRFIQQPSNATAGAPMPAIRVQIQDTFNNPVNTPNVQVTLQLSPLPPGATSPTANTDATGTATFNGFSVSATGSYTLLAVATGLQSGTSASFNIIPGAAANIVAVGGTPESTVVGTPFPLPLVALVTDSFANPVPNTTITFTVVPSGGAGGTFGVSSTASATTDQQGQAVAPTLTANTTAGTFTVTAAVGGKTATWTLTNLAGAVSQITFETQPSTTTAGAPISPPVVVKVADSHGNPVGGATVVLTGKEGPGSLEGTQTAVTAGTGQVTFSDLTLTLSGSYQIEASAVGVVQRSATFQVTAKTTNLSMQVIDGTAQTASIGTTYALPLQVQVRDEFTNPVPGASVLFTSPSTPGGANVTFNGTPAVTSDAAGIATSPTMTANLVIGVIAPLVTTPGAALPAVFALANTAGPATQLVFVQQPTNTAAGAAIVPPLTTQLLDAAGNLAGQGGVTVTVQLSPPGGGFSPESAPATQNTAGDGVATFANLAVAQAGTYQLQAQSDGLRSATSASFIIGAGTSSSITVVAGNNQSAAVTTNYVTPLKVSVQDSLANPVPGVAVTFTAPSSGASVTFLGPVTVTTDASGVAAIFVTANATVGAFQVTASTPSTAAPAVFDLTNVPGSASHLKFVQQPSSAAAGAVITPPVMVQLTDSIGNNVAQAGIAVTLTLNPAAGRSAAITGTTTVATNASGLASFADLSIAKAGSYQLTAVGTSLVSAQSSAFTITAGTASTIMVTGGSPQSTTVLAPFAVPLQVLVSDAAGNPLSGVAVNFAAPATGASATLSSAQATTDSAGHASVSAVANGVVGSYPVTASVTGVATPANFALTNVGGTGVTLAFTQQPGNTAAGTVLAPPVVVRVTDSGGNPVSGVTIALTAQGGTGVLSGAAPVDTNASGLATFSTLSIDKTGTYTLRATDGTRIISSASFVISAATSSSITVVTGNGQSAAVTTNYASQLKASVQDALGNGVPGIAVTFTAPSSGASVTFSGPATVTTDSSGVAAISVTANTQVGSFQVMATAPGTAAPAVFDLTNVPGSASHLTFVQQPSSAAAGAVIAPAVTVQLTDSIGNNVAQTGVAVTLELNPAVGRLAAIAGTTTAATNASGLASFADLTIAKAGSYQLTAVGTSPVSAQSSAFTITAGTASTITVTAGTPQSTTVLAPFAVPLQVLVSDAAGNPLSGVAVAFAAPATGASATLSAATATTDSAGHASVSAVANGVVGSYPVTASVTGIATPASFALTNVGGTGVTLAFTQQPGNSAAGTVLAPPVVVRVTDSGGNPVSGVTIALTAQGGTGVLSGAAPVDTNASGLATFSTLSIDKTGTYTLRATDGTRIISSASFVISAATSSSITVVTGNSQSAAVTTNYASQLKASVQDALGNGVPGIAVTFTAPSSGASVTFSGPATVTTDSSGVAAISVTANTQVGSFQVMATAPGTAAPAVFDLTNVPGSASHLTFVQQPSSAAAGAVIAPAVTVQLTDSIGNNVAQTGVAVTLELNPAVGRLAAIAGTTTAATNASGLASFADLTIAKAGSYQLTAVGTSLVSAQSSAFTITAGTAASITAIAGTPQSTTVLAPFAVPLQVLVSDAAGNPLSGVAVNFAAPATGASATLSAATATTDSAGHASVSATANNLAGSYEVTAVASGVGTSAKFSLTNANLTTGGGQLVFTQQPSDTRAGSIMTPVTVHLANSGGAPVPGVPITLSLENSGVPLVGTLMRTTDATGQAVFTDLSVRVTGTYRLMANALTVSGLSNSFQITAAASVSIIAISGTGQTAPVNTTYPFPLKAAVRDTFGNAVPGVPVTFTGPASGPGVVFAGSSSVITDNTGVATSPSMAANPQPGSFQVTATAPGAISQTLFSLTNTAGGAGELTFVQHPTDTQAGAVMAPVSVQLLDNAGNPVRTAGVPVSLVPISGPPASVFRGTLTKTTDASGMALFTDLSGVTAGTYQLAAQSGSLGSATSPPFRITPGPPAVIRATAGTPQSAAVLTAFVAPLEMTVTDTSGNPISGVSVVFTAPASGASGTFGGASTASVTSGDRGTASATLTANGTPGTYVVSAAIAAVAGPATFSLTNVATPARVLAFVQQPGAVASGQAISPSVTVQVRDTLGAPVNTAGIAISMTLASGSGALSGSSVSVTAANGIATFDNLRIDLAGTKSLRATAIELTPAESNPFIVTAGQASRIAAVGNMAQITTVSQVFAAPLQALVTDSMGNPVSGIPVTFSVPTSGPSGSFSGGPTVITGADGIAASPVLTASSTAGSFSATATTPNVAGVATFALVILPLPSTALTLDQQMLTFATEMDQPAPPPKTVTVSATSGGAVGWAASRSASWLTVSPISGVTPGQVSVSVNPIGLLAGAYLGTVTFTPPAGEAVVLVVSYTITPKPALTITPGSLIFQTPYQSDGTIPVPSAQTVSTISSSRPISYQISTTVTSPQGGAWLNLSAVQGQTPGAVQVSVTPSGLSEGIYRGSVLFQPTEAGISPVFVPVTLVVGCNRGACAAPPTESPDILGIVNSASFHISGAPGATMTIFGRNLSTSTMQALVYPLPTTLGTTIVLVNGAPVPLYYVSPGQINFQMPSNAPLGNARLEVNVGGQQVSSFDAQPVVMLTAVDPGLYMNGPRAAALNPDLTPHTAATPQPAGAILAFYLTGQGTVKPAIPDGSAAPALPLSIFDGTAQATIGGQTAEVIFAGLAPGYAGLAQVNVRIPQGLSPGDHPAFIVINGIPSNAGLVSVQ